MIKTFTLLLLYQLAGELIVRILGLPIPGPVVGMAFLFLTLLIRGRVSTELKTGTSALLQHLSLLFVPAGTGLILHLQRIGDELLPISVALITSSLVGLAVTAFVIKTMTGKDTERESA